MIAFSFTPDERRIFAKRDVPPVSAWAARHLIVQDGPYAGSPLRLDVAPYLAGILDAYNLPGVEEVIVCGSLQVGKTLILYSWLGFAMDFRPGTKMLVMPTRDTRDRVRDEKLYPLLKHSPTLKKLVAKYRRENTSLRDGTNLWLATAESPGHRASITVQDLFLDEEDLYEARGNARPVDDFKGRTRTLMQRKRITRVCQPKGENSSIFNAVTRETDVLYCFETRCPACQQYHLPSLDNLTVVDDAGRPLSKEDLKACDPLAVRRKKLGRYRCPGGCNGWPWSDHIRDMAVKNGRWRPYRWTEERGFEPAKGVESPRVVGFHAPAILSRMVSLSDLVAKKLAVDATDNPEIKQQFVNDELALPYSPTELQSDAEALLKLRDKDLPARTVPHGAVALTCGVDTQKRDLPYAVLAWMPSGSSWVVDYGILPDLESVFRFARAQTYPVQPPAGVTEPTGEIMPIWRTAIDSGGTETEGVHTRTEEVYMGVRQYGGDAVFACKGASTRQLTVVRPTVIDRMPHNRRPIPGGLTLYLIDTFQTKTLVFKRLQKDAVQPLRFHAEVGLDFTRQITAEKLVRQKGKLVWVRTERQNHYLDCTCLATAAADASWMPSLPHYIMQLQAAAQYEPPAPKPKQQRERRERPGRW